MSLPIDPTAWDRLLARVYANGPVEARAALGPALHIALGASEIGQTERRVAHFLAQVGHESGELRYRSEIWGPTPAQRRYEGRKDLGNVRPGDGSRFRGRGLIQLTGRTNYRAYGQAIGRDLEADPAAVALDPALCVGTAIWFWASRGCSLRADRDDIKGVTRLVNGGLNGLADRARLLELAKRELKSVWGRTA